MDALKKQFYAECVANTVYDEKQLEQICMGLESLPLEKVLVYVQDSFSGEQMKQIRLGLENLSLAEVMIYAIDDYSWQQMLEIRIGLETLPVDLVMKYAEANYSRETMGHIRMEMQREYFSKLTQLGTHYYYQFQIEEVLRAIKRIPFERALSIADSNLSAIEMEDRRRQMEQKFLQASIKVKKVLDEYSLDELLELSEYVTDRINLLSDGKKDKLSDRQKSLSLINN